MENLNEFFGQLSLSLSLYTYIYIERDMCACVCLYVCEYHKREDMTHLRLIQGGFIYNVTVSNGTNKKV